MTSNHLKIKFCNPHSSFQNGWHFMIPYKLWPLPGPTRQSFGRKLPPPFKLFSLNCNSSGLGEFLLIHEVVDEKPVGDFGERFFVKARKNREGIYQYSHIYAKPKVSTYQPKNTYKQTKY